MLGQLLSVDLVEFVADFEYWFNIAEHQAVMLTKRGQYAFVLLPISHYEHMIAVRAAKTENPRKRDTDICGVREA